MDILERVLEQFYSRKNKVWEAPCDDCFACVKPFLVFNDSGVVIGDLRIGKFAIYSSSNATQARSSKLIPDFYQKLRTGLESLLPKIFGW